MNEFPLTTDEADSLYDILRFAKEQSGQAHLSDLKENIDHFLDRLDELE